MEIPNYASRYKATIYCGAVAVELAGEVNTKRLEADAELEVQELLDELFPSSDFICVELEEK